MEITPKAMEIEYIRIKRLNLEKEKTYTIGCDMIDIHLFRPPVGSYLKNPKKDMNGKIRTSFH